MVDVLQTPVLPQRKVVKKTALSSPPPRGTLQIDGHKLWLTGAHCNSADIRQQCDSRHKGEQGQERSVSSNMDLWRRLDWGVIHQYSHTAHNAIMSPTQPPALIVCAFLTAQSTAIQEYSCFKGYGICEVKCHLLLFFVAGGRCVATHKGYFQSGSCLIGGVLLL